MERKKLIHWPVSSSAVETTHSAVTVKTTDPVTSRKPVAVKHAGGRPTKYDPSMCDRVVEMGRQGYCKAQMASKLGVSRECIYEWARVHEEFSYALLMAMTHAEAWWEEKARKALELPARAFNAGLWGKIMSARFPDTYRKTARPEPSRIEGKPIPVAVAHAPMTREDLAEWYKQFTDGWRKR